MGTLTLSATCPLLPLRLWTTGLLLLFCCVLITQAKNGERDTNKVSGNADAKALVKQFWQWRQRESPEYGTKYGLHSFDSTVEEYTEDAFLRRKVEAQTMLNSINRILSSARDLTRMDKYNLDIMKSLLQSFQEGYQFRYQGAYNPVNTMSTPISEWKSLISWMKYRNAEDYQHLIARFKKIPKQLLEMTALMRESIKQNTTLHNASMTGVVEAFVQLEKTELSKTFFYQPFLNMGNISMPDKNRLTNEAMVAIRDLVLPSFRRMRIFLEDEYMKRLRPFPGAHTLPNGKDYYLACIKWHTSQTRTPEQIHRHGLMEVDRIKNEMDKLKNADKFTGSLKEYINFLRNKTELFYDTEDEMLEGFRDMIKNKIHDRLNLVFKKIPQLRLSVQRSLSRYGPTGRYSEPPVDGSRPGIFWANVNDPKTRPKFDMMALALHEAEPGHHSQTSYAIEEHLPNFRRLIEYRKYYAVPYNWLFHTAYIEGWALYAEYLGEEMGLYDEPYALFGRYSSELFRACRLVVDTGIHAKGWSVQRATSYLANFTIFPLSQIEYAMGRHVTLPGEALSYKSGEIYIKELRSSTSRELGAQFDVREFHDEIMKLGPAPLHILGNHIQGWITSKRSSSSSSSASVSPVLLLSTLLLLIVPLTRHSHA